MSRFNYEQVPKVRPISSKIARMGRQVSEPSETKPQAKKPKKIVTRIRSF